MKHLLRKNCQRKTCTTRLFALLAFACFAVGFTHAQVVVSGVVIDEFAEPLIGVNVIVKNTTIGTTTDFDGKYSLTVPDTKSVLVFSLVGLAKQEITVGGKTIINVQMREDSQLLEDVVVIGFQSQKKVNLTASVANIGAEALENRPVSNVGQALQGMVPNLNISIQGGKPERSAQF